MRVILADDAVVVREGIARLLAEHGVEVLGQADTGEQLVRLVAADPPDVAVVDIRMPPTFTNEGLRRGAGDPRRVPARGHDGSLPVRRRRVRAEARDGDLGAGRDISSRTG